MTVRGILFDFGGTLDTGGDHWVHILYDVLRASAAEYDLPLSRELDMELYKLAFAHGERTLATQPIIQSDYNFFGVLFEKLKIQLKFISENSALLNSQFNSQTFSELVASKANEFARANCLKHATIIKELQVNYKIGLVSNFYGNIRTVLNDFELLPLFEVIIESARVGVKKPDPAIFQLGCEGLGLSPEECLVVGDSLDKDIRPALSIGCKAFWLEGRGWDDSDSLKGLADFPANGQFERIKKLEEISDRINSTATL